MTRIEEQPIGEHIEFNGAGWPQRLEHRGRYAVLRPLNARTDAKPLYEVSHAPAGDPSIWTYLYTGPYPNQDAFTEELEHQAASSDPLFFAVTKAGSGTARSGTGGSGEDGVDTTDADSDGRPLGVITYMSIVPEHGSIELGNIWFSSELKRTPAATEAIYLLTKHAFDELGYRRVEWKCNALNQPSRKAATRFGFEFEGIFMQHRVVKGRNRDTAWYAITDARWPDIRETFERWLDPENFDDTGNQRESLGHMTQLIAQGSKAP